MDQYLLIMGMPHAPLRETATAAVQQGFGVLMTAADVETTAEDDITVLDWRPGSTISTRAVVSAAREHVRSRQAKLAGAVLLVSPPQENRGFHEIPPGKMELAVQQTYAGSLFVLRELLADCVTAGGGTVTVVLDENNQEILPPLAQGIMHGIQRTVDGLFRAYQNETVVVQGVKSLAESPESVAHYLCNEYLRRVEKTEYRWTKFTGKAGIFGKAK